MGASRVEGVDAAAGLPLQEGFADQDRAVGTLGIQLGQESLFQRNADRTFRQAANRNLGVPLASHWELLCRDLLHLGASRMKIRQRDSPPDRHQPGRAGLGTEGSLLSVVPTPAGC